MGRRREPAPRCAVARGCSLAALLEQIIVLGTHDRLCSIGCPQLPQQIGHVFLRGHKRDHELGDDTLMMIYWSKPLAEMSMA
jgi:hypothetical protein